MSTNMSILSTQTLCPIKTKRSAFLGNIMPDVLPDKAAEATESTDNHISSDNLVLLKSTDSLSGAQQSPPSSTIVSYFKGSHKYLNRKYSEINYIDYATSQNYKRKMKQEDDTEEEEREDDDYEEDQEEEGSGLFDHENDEEGSSNHICSNNKHYQDPSGMRLPGNYNNIFMNNRINSYAYHKEKTQKPQMTFNQDYLLMTSSQIQQQSLPRFNSTSNLVGNHFLASQVQKLQSIYNQESINQNIQNTNEENITEMYGRRGWICSECSNFNYESRAKCNRCTNIKSYRPTPHVYQNVKKPHHKTQKKIFQQFYTNTNTNTNLQSHPIPVLLNMNPSNINCASNSKKAVPGRTGDWFCPKCQNLNFSFRKFCNKCKLNKNGTEQINVN